MKGIILAGGTGSRLWPLTKIFNKHLLPVYDKPMIYYPIEFLVASGITEIMLIVGGNSAGDFLPLLGNGEQFGLKRLNYAYQAEPKGIADALSLAEEFVGKDSMCVVLGDNIFGEPIKSSIDSFVNGAFVFGTQVDHPEHYGVVEMNDNCTVARIVEKPKNPTSKIIATGLYVYDSMVWDFLEELTPSARGELEITDINNMYIQKKLLSMFYMRSWWADCGENFDGYLEACNKVRASRQKCQRPEVP